MERGHPGYAEYIVEKKRFDEKNNEYVTVVEDEAYRERLRELRERSATLNKDVQAELEKAGVRSIASAARQHKGDFNYPPILQLKFLLRPEFYPSIGGEEKSEKTRYNASDDTITFFLHLTARGDVQEVRQHRGFNTGPEIYATSDEIIPFDDETSNKAVQARGTIGKFVHSGDYKGLATYVANQINPRTIPEKSLRHHIVHFFESVYRINSPEEAAELFKNDRIFSIPGSLIRNMVKAALVRVVEQETRRFKRNNTPLKEQEHILRGRLEQATEKIAGIPIGDSFSTKSAHEFVPDFVDYAGRAVAQGIDHFRRRTHDRKVLS